MIFLSLCVLVCEVFYNLPINITVSQLGTTNSNKTEEVGFISPLIAFEYTCNYCYSEWEISYVYNASLYTTFLLFTRESGPNYKVVAIGNPQNLIDQGFNTSKITKLLIHGWEANGTNYFSESVRIAYLKNEDMNIISVNWADMSETLYPLARSAVGPVGSYTATFVEFLINDVKISSESLHLVGHSLGAHVAGIVGECVTFGNLSRITGLDPAAPMFDSDPHGRLDASDANFVDVIHTTGGYLGYYEPCGHVDFYPNGGVPIQPGCGLDIGLCSHERAYDYFSESISSLGFISTACVGWCDYTKGQCENNNKTIMGEHVDFMSNGTYYLFTNNKSPFAQGNKSFTIEHEINFHSTIEQYRSSIGCFFNNRSS